MGQLRNGILALQKSTIDMEPEIAALESQQAIFHDRVFVAGKRISEGLNALVLYLLEKLKKAGTTLEAQGAQPLKSQMDGTITTFGKGIVQAKADVKKVIADLNAQQKAAADKLLASIHQGSSSAASLKALADKKKAKWLKSAKYKAKVAGYLSALGAINDILARQAQEIQALAALEQNDSWVERNYKFSQDMTVKQVHDLQGIELTSNLKDFTANQQAIAGRARKFRDEYKSLGVQFATMKKWAEDAEGMEAEAEEK